MTRLGILGGGQLARMLALAAHPLGIRTVCLDPGPDACAGAVAELIVAAYDDPEALDRLAAAADVVTFEFESVPAESAERLAELVAVAPPPLALATAQDRLHEKRLFNELGIETPEFQPIASQDELDRLSGLPAVVKTRRLGYDGKGQRVIANAGEAAGVFDDLGGVPLIAEALVPFDRELSIVAVRAANGEVQSYPLVENHHAEGILRMTRAPAAGVPPSLQAVGEDYARRLLEALGYVGVLALELFQVGDRLLANEMAPRVHNSGHWSIDASTTSQFENHVRAVAGLPLGPADVAIPSVMLNLIGRAPDTAAVLAIAGAHLHLYDKAPRPGRKIGHVTVAGGEGLEQRVGAVRALL